MATWVIPARILQIGTNVGGSITNHVTRVDATTRCLSPPRVITPHRIYSQQWSRLFECRRHLSHGVRSRPPDKFPTQRSDGLPNPEVLLADPVFDHLRYERASRRHGRPPTRRFLKVVGDITVGMESLGLG